VEGIEANEERCREQVHNSTACLTALVPVLGYEKASEIAKEARQTGKSVRETVLEAGLLKPEEFEDLISPEAVCRLGTPVFVAADGQSGRKGAEP
jgi:aspartate ammonia-lyase